ncbi:hypothetical protein ACFL4T_08725 [candidate division KSB1 bacterium]
MKIIRPFILILFVLLIGCANENINFVDKKSEDFKIVENTERGLYQKSLPINYNFGDYGRVTTEKGFALEFSYRIGADKYDKNKVFRYPGSFELDSKGNIYIVDTGNHRVQKFSRGGKHLLTIGGVEGTESGQFNMPTDIAVDKEDNIYITDHENNRVQVFTESGEFLKVLNFGNKKPAFIDVDSEANLYIHHMGNTDALIWKYNNDGELMITFGKPFDSKEIVGAEISSFGQAEITIDKKDNVYVCHKTQFVIDKYDKNGIHLMRIKKEPRAWIKERIIETRNYNIDTGSNSWGQFIFDISISPEGYLWAANVEGIDIYSPEGEYLYFLRMNARGGTEFVPNDIIVVSEKQVYFLNESTNTMTIFYIARKNIPYKEQN